MKYRRDIDGLRALAVVPVVLFHAHLPFMPGGYVGVDIFFVISGFLITGIIHREISENRFTFADFYERRLRRIIPALLVVLATTLLVGAAIMLPGDFEDTTDTAFAALFSFANFYFWADAGYFSGPAESKPLLHTWSLAVEEQFYLFWPILLMLFVGGLRRWLTPTLIALAVASLALAQWQVSQAPDAAFYLLPSRAWQLAAGGMIAIGTFHRPTSQQAAGIAAGIGLLTIAASILLLTPRTPFPGIAALPPTLGAALIIWAGLPPRADAPPYPTAVSRLLGTRALVGIGLISYALYLWHWPVFVLAKYVNRDELSVLQYAGLILLAVALAYLTYYYIEQPFRRRTGPFDMRRLGLTLGAGAAVIVAVAGVSRLTEGLPQRLPAEARAIAAAAASYGIASDTCLNRGLDRIARGDLCVLGKRGNSLGTTAASGASAAQATASQASASQASSSRVPERRFLLWGDSHAEALAPGIDFLAREAEATVQYAARDACPPLPGATQFPTARNAKCPAFLDAMRRVVEERNITDVILAARWNLYAGGWPAWGIESRQSEQFFLHDAETSSASLQENTRVLTRALRRTVTELTDQRRRVWIIAQVPYAGFRVPAELALARFSPIVSARAGPDPAKHDARAAPVTQIFDDLAQPGRVTILNPSQQLCAKTPCLLADGSTPIYRDDDHLSREGALLIAPSLAPIFAPLAQ
ncbi:MAG: acyltransferase family protein [Pseudomonadota bacterium]